MNSTYENTISKILSARDSSIIFVPFECSSRRILTVCIINKYCPRPGIISRIGCWFHCFIEMFNRRFKCSRLSLCTVVFVNLPFFCFYSEQMNLYLIINLLVWLKSIWHVHGSCPPNSDILTYWSGLPRSDFSPPITNTRLNWLPANICGSTMAVPGCSTCHEWNIKPTGTCQTE